MAWMYKQKSALAAKAGNPDTALEGLISQELGDRARAHITPQEALMAGTKKMKRKLKERMDLARMNGGMVGQKKGWLSEDAVDDDALDPLGLKRKRAGMDDEEEERKRRNGSVRGATWLNKYLDHVDYIDNTQLERMAKAQAELQLRDEMGLARRPQAFDPTWGRSDPHGESASKGLDVFNSMSPTLVTHRVPAAVASSAYPHAPWCVGHMCGMTCNPEGAKQWKEAMMIERREAREAERSTRMQFKQGSAIHWGETTKPIETQLDLAVAKGKDEVCRPAPRREERRGPAHAIQPIIDPNTPDHVLFGGGGASCNNLDARANALAPGLTWGKKPPGMSAIGAPGRMQPQQTQRPQAAAQYQPPPEDDDEEAEC